MPLPGVKNIILDRSNHKDSITYLDDGKDKTVSCPCGEWKVEVFYRECDLCKHVERKHRTIE